MGKYVEKYIETCRKKTLDTAKQMGKTEASHPRNNFKCTIVVVVNTYIYMVCEVDEKIKDVPRIPIGAKHRQGDQRV